MTVTSHPTPATKRVPTFRPVRNLQLHLERPISEIVPAMSVIDGVYTLASVLVRLHTIPIGIVEVRLTDGMMAAETLAGHIWASLSDAITSHLASDGMAAPMSLSVRGVGDAIEPACLGARRSAIAAAPRVTVVVPTVDRPDLLWACLDDLAGQNYGPFDILVVDNAPKSSRARAVIADRQGGPTVRYVAESYPGSSAARNRGLLESHSPITVFVDADVRIDERWLAALITPFVADSRIGCVTGLILPAEIETRAQGWIGEWGGFGKGLEPMTYDLTDHRPKDPLYPYQATVFGSGPAMAFRTDVLLSVGGFDLGLGAKTAARGGEDVAAFLDVVLAGWRLAYAPDAIVWHPDDRGDEAFFGKLRSYGVGLTAFLARTAATHQGTAGALLRRAPSAVGYFFSGRSDRNVGRSAGFPAGRVRREELLGMATGPFAYVISRRRVRRRKPALLQELRRKRTMPDVAMAIGRDAPPELSAGEGGRPADPTPATETPSRRSSIVPPVAVAAALAAFGLLLVAIADNAARGSRFEALPIWWLGYAVLVLPLVAVPLWSASTRRERLAATVLLGLLLYLVKVLHSPLGFTLPDEFSHLRTAADILASGRLLAENPLLVPSPSYPGLEVVTVAVNGLTGLSVFHSGLLVVGVARILTVVGIFLLIETLSRSSRAAGLGAAIYMANPSFLFFDAAFSYESLAIGLAVVGLWAAVKAARASEVRAVYAVGAVVAIAGTAMTHHLTSLALAAALMLWAVAVLVRGGGPDRRRMPLALAAVAIAANAAWLGLFASPAVEYLSKIASGGISGILETLAGQAGARRLFATPSDLAIPLPEVVASYAAVGILMVALLIGVVSVLGRRRSDPFALLLLVALVLYPAGLALRFVGATSEIATRVDEFVFVSIGFVVADSLVRRLASRDWKTRAITLGAAAAVFAGAATLGTAHYVRLPGPYRAATEARSIEPIGEATASWTLEMLGPGNRFLADRTNAKLLAALGRQQPITAFNSGIATAYAMFAPAIGPEERAIIRDGNVRFVLADRRLTTAVPAFPYYFESAEPRGGRHTAPFPAAGLDKFDADPTIDRIFDGGDIVIYDLRALLQ